MVETLRRLVVLAVVSASAAACGGCGSQVFVDSFTLEGKDRFLTGNAPEAMRRAALADQASRDLGCPAAAVRVVEHASTEVYAVEACGRRAVYLAVARVGVASKAPGFEGTRVLLFMTRFVLVSEGDPRSAIASLEHAADGYGPLAADPPDDCYDLIPAQLHAHTSEEALKAVGNWIALSVQGSRDLTCPRSDVFVDFRPGHHKTPIAEGCGKRAVYLPGSEPPFQLASVVPVNGP